MGSDALPTAFAIDVFGDSSLIVDSWADAVGDMRLQYRVVDPRGKLRDGSIVIATDATAVRKQDRVRIPPGKLLHISLEFTRTVGVVGDVFARVSLGGETSGNPLSFPLAQGFLGGGAAIAWPNSMTAPADGQVGRVVRDDGPNPAAGAESSNTMANGVSFEFMSARVQLVTDVTAANRNVSLEMVDAASNVIARLGGDFNQVASTTITYFFTRGSPRKVTGEGNFIQYGGGEVTLGEGFIVRTSTVGLQLADDFTALSVWGSRFFRLDLS